MTSDDVFTEVLKDRDFYRESGGGITLSGGEPLLQPDFTMDLFGRCKAAGIHTALDTAGNVPPDVFGAVVGGPVDLVILDLKLMDDAEHKRVTGVSNKLILENLETALTLGTPLTVRVPVVPDVNDNRDNMERCAARLEKGNGQVKVELLGFHRLGTAKYASLDMDYAAASLPRPDDTVLSDLAGVFRARNLAVEFRTVKDMA
jgi:pyruvate formate lyase activating enzyme